MRLKYPFRKLFGMSKRDHHHVPGGTAASLSYIVPFVHQNHINLCGDASAQMLLGFHGTVSAPDVMKANRHHYNSFRLRRNPREVLTGANADDVSGFIRAISPFLNTWNICPAPPGRWTRELVYAALETYGPYAQSVRFSFTGHWVVVVGVDDQFVIYHDPWRGQNMRKTLRDWGMVSKADRDSVVAATADMPDCPVGLIAPRY